jgi:hypothetical protein
MSRQQEQQQQYYKPPWVGNISIGRELLLFLYLGWLSGAFSLHAVLSFYQNGNKFAVLVRII